MTTSVWPRRCGHTLCAQEPNKSPRKWAPNVNLWNSSICYLKALLKTHPCSHSSESETWIQLPRAAELASIPTWKPLPQEVDRALNTNHPVFPTQSAYQQWAATATGSRHSLKHQSPPLPHCPPINHRAATAIRNRHSLKYWPHPLPPHTQRATVNTVPGTWYSIFQDILGPCLFPREGAVSWPHLHTFLLCHVLSPRVLAASLPL